MNIEIEKKEGNVAELKIQLPAQDGVNAYNTAVMRLGMEVNVPGFRKGKVPRNILEQRIGKERIKIEALERMLPSVLSKAVSENKLDVIAQPQIKSYKFEIGQDLELLASVELRPEVTMGDYKGQTVEVEKYELPKDAFDRALDNVIQQYSTLEQVVDRNTKSDDIIVFDFDGYVDGEKIPHGDAKNYTMDLANSSFIPGFAEQLVDRPVDTDFDINVTFPEEYHEESLRGKEAVFKCKIHEIKTRVLPELNDELAQKAGPFKTVEELKTNIQEYLDKQVENENRKRSEKALFELFVEKAQVDLSDSMILREKNSLLSEYKHKLAEQGFSWENAVEAQGIEELNKNVEDDAKSRIKNSLVIGKIAELEDLKISQEDFTKKIEMMQHLYNLDSKAILSNLQSNPGFISELNQQILNEKVLNFLVENNTVKFVKAKK
ncbi:trigger factor [bacterium]|nr:trigger factor [bacterium]